MSSPSLMIVSLVGQLGHSGMDMWILSDLPFFVLHTKFFVSEFDDRELEDLITPNSQDPDELEPLLLE